MMRRSLLILLAFAGVAAARPPRGERADNMPRGFTWPPSKTMVTAAKACEAKLDELGVAWKPAAREGHVVDALALPDGQIGGISYTDVYAKKPPVMDCQLVLALASF